MAIYHNCIENDAFDQLELSSMHFDLLRSIWEMNVVPTSLPIEGAPKWYSNLTFPCRMTTSTSGILAWEGAEKKLVWNGLQPKLGEYYHPGQANHPWIDRFFIAVTKDGKKCLVLYQDKINAVGFTKAVGDLNLAADILTAGLAMPVLCIANVIGASSETIKQSVFKHPYVLVRDSELDSFYTPNFAPAIQFLRTHFSENGMKYASSRQA
jgi:hypothetical protein